VSGNSLGRQEYIEFARQMLVLRQRRPAGKNRRDGGVQDVLPPARRYQGFGVSHATCDLIFGVFAR
jgi:hypothetical protein